jgi:hypothetical protein
MFYRVILSAVVCLGFVLVSCGTPRDPATAALETFANAMVKERYDDAMKVVMTDAYDNPADAREDIIEIRNAFVDDYGALKGAVVSEVNLEKELAMVTWQFEQADIQMAVALQQVDEKTVKVMPIPFFAQAGRLTKDNVFATLTPLPTATPNAEQMQRTADTIAQYSTATARAISSYATSTAQVIAWQATEQAENASATTVAMHATATELARPPELYLTARQAFLQAEARAEAKAWSDDAMLVGVSSAKNFDSNNKNILARDGTARLWFYLFASPSLQKTMWLTVQDGFILEQSNNDAAYYKEMFAGRGEPFDLVLEEHLDSDQVTTIARENGLNTDDPKLYVLMLSVVADDDELRRASAGRWTFGVTGFFTGGSMRMHGKIGEIYKNSFGPTGSPGALPTPIAPVNVSAAAAPTATPTATAQASEDDEATIFRKVVETYFGGPVVSVREVIRSADGSVVQVTITFNVNDPITGFLQKKGDTWEVLTIIAGMPDAASLRKAGVPEDLIPEGMP